MAYTDQYALGEDATFRSRIQVAILTAAVAIQGEDKTSFTDQQYSKRQNLARMVIHAPTNYAVTFARLITTAASVTAATTDTQLQNIINSNWSKVAGIDVND